MKNIKIEVSGMHCASCSTLVEKAIKKNKGIGSASVNLSTSKASVEFDDKETDEGSIIKSIEKRGYGAKIITDNDKASFMDLQKKERDHYRKLFFLGLVFAVPAFILGMVFMWIDIMIPYVDYILWALATPVQFYIGKEFYKGTWNSLKNKSANMDTLVALGTSAAYFFSVYNVLFFPGNGQYFETSAILITLVMMGKWLEAVAKSKTSDAIRKLMELSPKTAIVLKNGKEIKVHIDKVNTGDLIIVKPGQKIPVDGVITEGQSSIDESMITGESIPVMKKKDDQVFSATINKHGTFTFRATKIGSNTTLSRIIQMIEKAQEDKAPVQRFADIVSSYFVPVIIIISLLSFLVWYFLLGSTLNFAFIVSVAVLVIACPCALGLATPTAIMVGSGKGAKEGILIKGGEALEIAHNLKYVIFDKTGTITKGTPKVTDVIVSKDVKEKDVIKIAASIENVSEHPLADAITEYAKSKKISLEKITDFEATPGYGVQAKIKKKQYYLGNQRLLNNKKIKNNDLISSKKQLESEGKTVMILFDENKILGLISVADVIRKTSKKAVKELQSMGIQTFMITGDNERTAKAIAKQAGIKNVFSEVLPEDKAKHVKKLKEKGSVAMVGDGINDAPALAVADIGIAMGSGTDVAMEVGNIVLMKDDILDVSKSIKLSKMTMSKIKQNLFWALFYNSLGIPIAAGLLYPYTGWLLSPIIAGAAMAMSSVCVVSNSLLLKRKKL